MKDEKVSNAGEPSQVKAASGAADGSGGVTSVSGDTHPIPGPQVDAADESGGVLSVSGDTHPIPAKAAAADA